MGKLYTHSFGLLSARSVDPVEKKPLYHFLPGRPVLSVGSYGCNLSCDFCQNHGISQFVPGAEQVTKRFPPDNLVDEAEGIDGNIGLAYTYNEPVVFYEYMRECAIRVRERHMKNLVISNGYIEESPLRSLLPLVDAFNIDLKSFTENFYKSRCSARLSPVLRTISTIAESDAHLELTFLIIPGYNDHSGEWKKMLEWIRDNCGKDSILHVSRYFPRYKLDAKETSTGTMMQFTEMAREYLDFVYPGNAPELDNNTRCPSCGSLQITRNGYHTESHVDKLNGSCSNCGSPLPGVFID